MLWSIKKRIRALPPGVQRPFFYLYGRVPVAWRLGPLFVETHRRLQQSQWWDPQRLADYQWNRIKRVIAYSFERVPYYRDMFRRLGLKPADIQSMKEFRHLPFLTREDIEANFEMLMAEGLPARRSLVGRTGGTSGVPLRFGSDAISSRPVEYAFISSMWARVGFDYRRSVRVGMRGRVIAGGKDVAFDPRFRIYFLSTFKMRCDDLARYCAFIRKVRPDFLWTYPSAASQLAEFLLDRPRESLPPLKAVLCSSENIYPQQRTLIEKAFKTRMFSWYGHSEQVILAGECEYSTDYHVFPEYGLLELIDSDGRVIEGAGVAGEMVGTGFHNMVMPLIRYRTRDYAEWAGEAVCRCGRNYPRIRNTRGRWLQEMFVGRNGNLISMTAVNTHTAIFDDVKQFQFFQEKAGEVTLRIVPKPNYRDESTRAILAELNAKFGGSIDVHVTLVDEIPKTQRGKHQFIIQKLAVPDPGKDHADQEPELLS